VNNQIDQKDSFLYLRKSFFTKLVYLSIYDKKCQLPIVVDSCSHVTEGTTFLWVHLCRHFLFSFLFHWKMWIN